MKDYPICTVCRQPIYKVVVSGLWVPQGLVKESDPVPPPRYYHPGCAPVTVRREAGV